MDLFRLVDRFSGIISISNVRVPSEDFFIDRLHYQFTTGILTIFAFLCGLKSTYTVPIICWIPAQLRRYERAITAYCYANNTYYVPDDRRVPPTAEERYDSLIIYYQWLPWIFGVQAILVYAPKLIWKLLLSGDERNVRSLLETANRLYIVPKFDKNKAPSKQHEEQIIQLNATLFGRKNSFRSRRNRGIFSFFYSSYFLFAYLFVKMLYILNIFLQIGLIHLMVGSRSFSISSFNARQSVSADSHFVAQFMHKISSGLSELIDTSSFPKRTLCDFTFRELASNHAYTVECILPLNMIVEKMYVFLYLWFIILGIITILDFFKWIGHLIRCLIKNERSREKYVRSHLIDQSRHEPEEIKNFIREQLEGNHYFLLKLLSKNVSTFVVVDMLEYYFRTKASHLKKDD